MCRVERALRPSWQRRSLPPLPPAHPAHPSYPLLGRRRLGFGLLEALGKSPGSRPSPHTRGVQRALTRGAVARSTRLDAPMCWRLSPTALCFSRASLVPLPSQPVMRPRL